VSTLCIALSLSFVEELGSLEIVVLSTAAELILNVVNAKLIQLQTSGLSLIIAPTQSKEFYRALIWTEKAALIFIVASQVRH
jgi:hypothetical protein